MRHLVQISSKHVLRSILPAPLSNPTLKRLRSRILEALYDARMFAGSCPTVPREGVSIWHLLEVNSHHTCLYFNDNGGMMSTHVDHVVPERGEDMHWLHRGKEKTDTRSEVRK